MQENIFRLNIKRRIAIVLDASNSAEGHWNEIIECYDDIINNFPGDVEREIYFLGNSKRYTGNVLACANEWRKENENRGSFITPILEKTGDVEKVIVMGSGRIFDLMDYAGTNFADKIFLVRIGESLKEDENIGKEITQSDIENLYDSVEEIVIKGTGFMPYYWDNDGYKFELGDEGAVLRGVDLESFSVLVRGFGYEIEAAAKTKKGETMKFNIEEDKDANIEEEWKNLEKDDENLFKESINTKKYICPVCGKQHDYKRITCRNARDIIFETCIYKSLRNVRGFVIFREAESKILYTRHPVNVLKLSDEEVAVAKNRFEVDIYKFKVKEQKWVWEGKFENYYKINDKKWIICL